MGAVVTLLKLSCDKNGRDYCLSDWQKVGDIFDGVNNTLSQNYGVSSLKEWIASVINCRNIFEDFVVIRVI